jgi:hypothetical protein
VQAERGKDIVVVISRRDWVCASCGQQAWSGNFLTMDDTGPLCLDCADLGHLDFLPSGNTALTRRAKKNSRLSAVVVQWSRTRKRYERQGVLAEPDAVDQAEVECLADSELRERRRERAAERRQVEDETFVGELAAAVRSQYPSCPADRPERIARHAGVRSSGRIGRSAAGRSFDPRAVTLAVVASVRHEDTAYEELLMAGVARARARDRVRADIDEVLAAWTAQPTTTEGGSGST